MKWHRPFPPLRGSIAMGRISHNPQEMYVMWQASERGNVQPREARVVTWNCVTVNAAVTSVSPTSEKGT